MDYFECLLLRITIFDSLSQWIKKRAIPLTRMGIESITNLCS